MAGDVTLGDLTRMISNNAITIGGTIPAPLTATTIQGTRIKATSGLICPVETSAATTTTANLAIGGVSKFGSTAATTFTLAAPAYTGMQKQLHCVTATSLANVTVDCSVQVGDTSTTTKIVFAAKGNAYLIAESTAIWGIYGSTANFSLSS